MLISICLRSNASEWISMVTILDRSPTRVKPIWIYARVVRVPIPYYLAVKWCSLYFLLRSSRSVIITSCLLRRMVNSYTTFCTSKHPLIVASAQHYYISFCMYKYTNRFRSEAKLGKYQIIHIWENRSEGFVYKWQIFELNYHCFRFC